MLTTEIFINRSNIKHNYRYDYSLVKYLTDRIKVKIICKEHGVFEQIPLHHMRGVGCPKCCGMYKTTKDIILEFNKKHDNFYDYSLFTNYIKASNKIEIICPVHGIFKQSVNSHLQGHGCKKCSTEKISKKYSFDTKIFIEKSIQTHNDFYDYSLVEYKNSHTKVKIICPVHGVFEQSATKHLSGHGCRKCGVIKMWDKRKIGNIDFIDKCNLVHKYKYDYSLVEYVNAKSKVIIICPIHGIFEQTPNSHLMGKGCSKCSKNRVLTNDLIIKKANKKHKNFYDYSLINYVDKKTKIEIICPIHGIFEQTAYSHIGGCGCPKCHNEKHKKNIDKQRLGIDKFIERSNKAHKNKYEYNLVEYINCKIKVKIICPIHGIFEQSPDHHSRGVGCPECSKTYGGKFSDRFLYIFYDYNLNLMKIGSSKNPEKRLKEISKGKDRSSLKLIKKYEFSALLENKLHKYLNEYNIEHSVYDDGKTEWFNIPLDDLYKIDNFIEKEKASF